MRRYLLTLLLPVTAIFAASPEVAEFGFDSRWNRLPQVEGTSFPSWITGVNQFGGTFVDEPRCWRVDAATPKGKAWVEIAIDRTKIPSGNLLATLLFEADADTDFVVQLFDSQGRAVVVDLFGNVVDIGQQATTDTFVIPLARHPTADRIVIRRVQGGLRLHGMVLFPVVSEGGADMEPAALLALAIAQKSQVPVAPVKAVTKFSTSTSKKHAPAKPVVSGSVPAAPTEGLLAHFSFDQKDAADSSPHGRHGEIRGGAAIVSTERGTALHLNKNPGHKRLASGDSVVIPTERSPRLSDRLSLCAWVRYHSLPKSFGSQIIWHGDKRPGLDPWVLHVLSNGKAEFRSDRSVTGRPTFRLAKNEIQLTPAGEKRPTQQIAVQSPLSLEAGQWYYVVGTMDMLSTRTRTMRLYINGALVSEIQTPEAVEYPTEGMWTTLGAVENGGWQNLDGEIDDVRIYDRALTPEEVQALYSQPWK
jgi:hypothetical protein